ncbi:protein-cysteine N-palmitoyltransferase HHAT [Colletes gigas]|uniref:protein-cysteine N-palmitoyltransferase HHAT n=1 Tax=Colletes gigas TaxID=935657 RepID=UPI001C9A2DEC|nr:protein-cysteine N-palmitoyltransferase HHAT [Colletes gigas]XP_043257793.1 protein-cysteine N-palmitoyltransferase HHAT [Colletes gigas]
MSTVTNSVTNLNKYESIFYFCCWTGAVLYSAYKVFLVGTYFNDYHDLYNDFAPGWIWIGRKRDVSDQEWKIWIPLIIKLVPWIFCHHLVSQIIKTVPSTTLLCYWYIFTSISFLYFYIGSIGVLCVLMQLSILYILTYKRNKSIIWSINILFLFFIHFLKIPDGTFQSILKFNDEEHYILIVIMCWILLRSISYSIDNIQICSENNSDDNSHLSRNFLWGLAYCLYLPTLCLGPLILYHEFINSMKGPFQVWKLKELKHFTLNLIRYIFWIIFANFSLHFLYFNAIQYHSKIVEFLNPWALYGLGYCIGQFFLIKYVVIYGLNHTLCAIDHVKAPSQPKCVARIHLYSDMWKYFDKGLYKFLIRYIYTPLLKSNFNRVFASFLCFTFVFAWHGMQRNIFFWALFNFIGLNIESLVKSAGKSKYYSNVQRKYMSPANARRFNCVLASPLLAMSVISNFYFFAGEEIGHTYVYRILHDMWYGTLVLLFFLYCCCQVSTDVKNWESKNICR